MLQNKRIGQLIKARRKELGLTIEDLSFNANVSISHLQNIECGKRGMRDATRKAVFDALGMEDILDNKPKTQKEVIMDYLDKIQDDWAELTYRQIRREIYRDSKITVYESMLSKTCGELGVDRSKIKEINRKRKFQNWIY